MQQSHQKPLLFSPTLSRGRSVILLSFLHNYKLWIQIFSNSFEIFSQKHSYGCSCRVCPWGQRGWESEVLFLVKLFAYNFVQIQKYTEENTAGNFRALSVLALWKSLAILSAFCHLQINTWFKCKDVAKLHSFITVCWRIQTLKHNWLWKSEPLQFDI